MKMNITGKIDVDSTRAVLFTHTDEVVTIAKLSKGSDDRPSTNVECKLCEPEARMLLRYLAILFPDEVN